MGVRERIVACARSHIGDPYNTAASYPRTGPASDYDSFNCSGLTRAVYEECGLTIPGWQGAQNGSGSQSDWVRWNDHWTTDPDELKPGDLVFFGYYDGERDMYITSHVGISLGGWDMIDSVPDGGVQERALYGSFVGGGWPLEGYPEDDGALMVKAQGTYVWDWNMNIRTAPSTDADIRGTLVKGETRNVDGIVIAEDKAWGHYIGSESGKDCYVALTGREQFARAVG